MAAPRSRLDPRQRGTASVKAAKPRIRALVNHRKAADEGAKKAKNAR
jgi:hypothetical protein